MDEAANLASIRGEQEGVLARDSEGLRTLNRGPDVGDWARESANSAGRRARISEKRLVSTGDCFASLIYAEFHLEVDGV